MTDHAPGEPDETQQPQPPAWPAYGPPPPPYGQAPHGAPVGFPGYGQPVPGYHYAQPLGKATTAMVLGIIALVSVAATPLCCVTLPGMLVAPFAIWTGSSARRQIDQNPAAYTNRGQAVAGFIMGIIGTVLAVLVIVAIALFVGLTDWSDISSGGA